MTVEIPVWLLWALGMLAGVVVFVLAALGVLYLIGLRQFNRVMHRHFGW